MADVVTLEGLQAETDLGRIVRSRLASLVAPPEDFGLLEGKMLHWMLLAILTVTTVSTAMQG